MAQQTVNQVLFKYGTEANLFDLTSSATNRNKIQPGTFYITSDTNRMYLGVARNNGSTVTNDIVALNEGVISVAELKNLPDVALLSTEEKARLAGQLYYVISLNVLCVFNGKTWVQLNPDTYINEFKIETKQEKDVKDAVTYDGTISNTVDNSTLTFGWKLISDESITLTLADTKTNTVKITSELRLGTEASPTTGNEIEKNVATFVLTGRDNEEFSRINIKGDAYIDVQSKNDGTISIGGSKLHKADIKKVGSKIDGDGNWYVEIGLQDENVTITPNATDSTQPFKPTIVYGKVDPTTGEKQKAVFAGEGSEETAWGSTGNAVLDVYTIGQVDSLITDAKRDINAMTYKGTTPTTTPSVSGNKFYPSAVSIGDTWKVASENYTTLGNWYVSKNDSKLAEGEAWAEVGDLLIANVVNGKTENVNGVIAAANLKWDYIPSGDDVNNIYLHGVKDHGFVINEKAVGEATKVLEVSLIEGTDIVLKDTKTGNDTIAIEISHAPKTAKYSTETIDLDNVPVRTDDQFNMYHTFSACNGVELDNGHVKTIEKRDYYFHDTNASMKEVAIATTEATINNTPSVKVDTSVKLKHYHQTNIDDIQTGGMYMQSANENIVLNASTVSVTENSKTITVPTVSFNLVWGTF